MPPDILAAMKYLRIQTKKALSNKDKNLLSTKKYVGELQRMSNVIWYGKQVSK